MYKGVSERLLNEAETVRDESSLGLRWIAEETQLFDSLEQFLAQLLLLKANT